MSKIFFGKTQIQILLIWRGKVNKHRIREHQEFNIEKNGLKVGN